MTRRCANDDFAATLDAECQNIVNPLLDGTKYLPHSVSSSNYGNYDDPDGNRAL